MEALWNLAELFLEYSSASVSFSFLHETPPRGSLTFPLFNALGFLSCVLGVRCRCDVSTVEASWAPAVRIWSGHYQETWSRTGLRGNHPVRKDMLISSSGSGKLETGAGYAVKSKLIFINFQCCPCKGCFFGEDEQECSVGCSEESQGFQEFHGPMEAGMTIWTFWDRKV